MLDAKRCEHCGKAFVPVDPDEGFCSEWCLRAHDRERSTVVIALTGNEYRRASDMSLVDPASNLIVAIEYINRRYGSVFDLTEANRNLPPRGYRDRS